MLDKVDEFCNTQILAIVFSLMETRHDMLINHNIEVIWHHF